MFALLLQISAKSNPVPSEPLSCMFLLFPFSNSAHSMADVILLLVFKFCRNSLLVHSDQLCWSRETSKALNTMAPEHNDWAILAAYINSPACYFSPTVLNTDNGSLESTVWGPDLCPHCDREGKKPGVHCRVFKAAVWSLRDEEIYRSRAVSLTLIRNV